MEDRNQREECRDLFTELYKLVNNHYVSLMADMKAIKWLLVLVLPLITSIIVALLAIVVMQG